jgi:hypothetical protein
MESIDPKSILSVARSLRPKSTASVEPYLKSEMTSFGNMKIRTKLMIAFASISIAVAACGFFGRTTLLLTSMLAGLVAGAIVANNIGAQINKVLEFSKTVQTGGAGLRPALTKNEPGREAGVCCEN